MLGQRIVALIIMVVPFVIAGYGIKTMRDAFYLSFNPNVPSFFWGHFLTGALIFLVPVLFIGGFVLHHERKRNRVQPRFMKRDPEDDEEDDD
nr:DUF2627 domain-containing protein [Brevibacillus daliensis]